MHQDFVLEKGSTRLQVFNTWQGQLTGGARVPQVPSLLDHRTADHQFEAAQITDQHNKKLYKRILSIFQIPVHAQTGNTI